VDAFAAEGGSEKMRTLNADQLKAVLSMESSLGHIHTLADVENTIDFLAKEEQEAVAGVEKFNIFDTMWSRKIQAAFPQSFVNMQNELIFSLRTDSGFSLKDVTDETQLKAKILEWLTRTAIKAVSPKERKLHFEGINKLLGTNFTLEEMTDIYTYLGNGINHDLCVKFVESGYDMTLLPKEV
jgi:phenylalanyl-tRNA synthetase beta subunit